MYSSGGRETPPPKGVMLMSREAMVKVYVKMSAAHRYIVGFIYNDKLYFVVFDGMIPEDLLTYERAAASKGGMMKIRVRVNAKRKAMLVHGGKAVELGKAEMLETTDKYNKGERFERVITETLTGEAWEKDSVPFWKAGDINWNGVETQIKMDGAELTNERTLARLMA